MKKLVVITGASSGIGKATAIKLSALGYPLLLLARREELIKNLNLPNTMCAKVDVTDLESFKSAIAAAEQKFGPVDCLINNAGVMLLGSAATQSPDEWHNMINVNLVGALNGIHCVLQSMLDRNSGTIINISSIAGRKTFPNHSAYCATKFAVHALTENIREEVSASNVRLIVIAPGVVETELLSHTTDTGVKDGYVDWKKTIDGGLKPDTIAETICFAYQQPQEVCIREIVIAKTKQGA